MQESCHLARKAIQYSFNTLVFYSSLADDCWQQQCCFRPEPLLKYQPILKYQNFILHWPITLQSARTLFIVQMQTMVYIRKTTVFCVTFLVLDNVCRMNCFNEPCKRQSDCSPGKYCCGGSDTCRLHCLRLPCASDSDCSSDECCNSGKTCTMHNCDDASENGLIIAGTVAGVIAFLILGYWVYVVVLIDVLLMVVL